jgi:hypothetical protein
VILQPKYTAGRMLRASRPDGQRGNDICLIKHVSSLRLTYQIRLLTYAASRSGGKLTLVLPLVTTLHPTLQEFLQTHRDLIQVQRV